MRQQNSKPQYEVRPSGASARCMPKFDQRLGSLRAGERLPVLGRHFGRGSYLYSRWAGHDTLLRCVQ
uniref:Uncharacterized protein n=1 Tax=Romanomermis culicivorax TaxID=13658 RepID=A0A915KR21_ROMCU